MQTQKSENHNIPRKRQDHIQVFGISGIVGLGSRIGRAKGGGRQQHELGMSSMPAEPLLAVQSQWTCRAVEFIQATALASWVSVDSDSNELQFKLKVRDNVTCLSRYPLTITTHYINAAALSAACSF